MTKLQNYNPDVLTCLANLSNDEVFTPPQLANQMLDMLPQELFRNPDTKFLDPCSKSGVFLREIAKRLIEGLADSIPDLQKRIDHIMHHQLYGVAITQLTALMSRRSLYCSKAANGEYSISHFDNADGNVMFENIRHIWKNGSCKYCGASQEVYDRADNLETYAYQFIHTDNPNELYNNMFFDVIIGNPPYQLSDGSGASTDAANPIYQLFVEQAIKLSPRYLCMIIPSKWMVGGKVVLNKFRDLMLDDICLKNIVDFENSTSCFSGLHIDGGVCYFLRDNQYNSKKEGGVSYTFTSADGIVTESMRNLKNDFFKYIIRDTRIFPILEKINAEKAFSQIVSLTKPFGIRKDLFNHPDRYPQLDLSDTEIPNYVKVHGVIGIKGGAKRKIGYIKKDFISSNKEAINKHKIFFTTSYSTNAKIPPEIIIADKNCVCTETFLMIGPFVSKSEQMNCSTYIHTNFFRFLLYYGKGTMQVNKEVFSLIPLQDFSKPWTDEELYAKYKLTANEIAFIESMIRPME